MKFITNRISTSKSSEFSDFVKKLAASNPSLSKTASDESSLTKKANIANFGDKKANPFGKKDEEKADSSDADCKKKEDGDEKETETCATSDKEVKIAKEVKKQDGVVKVKMQKMDPVGGTNTGKPGGEKKKASNSDVDPANKGVTHKTDECCGAPTSKSDDGSQGDKKAAPKGESKEEPKEEKKEASARNLVRIANLDSKTKNEWKKYWKNLYPTEYVEAMFADK